MKIPQLLLLFILGVSSIGRCTSSTESGSDEDVLLPLKVGNTWIGQVIEFDTTGHVLGLLIEEETVQEERIVDGERRFFGEHEFSWVNRDDGLYSNELRPSDEPRLPYRYPAVVGDEVQQIGDFAFGIDTVTVKVVSTDERISVPAGTFTCIHYFFHATYGEHDSHRYLSPNLGFVKIQYVNRPENPERTNTSVWALKQAILK